MYFIVFFVSYNPPLVIVFFTILLCPINNNKYHTHTPAMSLSSSDSAFINNEIMTFIESNFGGSLLGAEVNAILNNLLQNPCALPFLENNPNNVNGISTDIGSGKINFSYFIPNLFRSCYVSPNATVPNICNMFVFVNTNIDFYNILISPELIKSFLYYNFPCTISAYDPKTVFLDNILNIVALLQQKKRSNTCSANTGSVYLYQSIYSTDSLLTQLMLFYNYITVSKNASDMGTVIAPFSVKWEYTKACLCYDGNLQSTSIIGDKNSNTSISPSLGAFLYTLRVIFNTSYPTSVSSIQSIINKNNLIVVLNYALEVFQDVLMKIQAIIRGEDYCDKPYMNRANIPNLLSLYSYYYENQNRVNQKQNAGVSLSRLPQVTIQQTVLSFIKTYLTSTSGMYPNNTIVLSSTTAIVVFCNIVQWGQSAPAPVTHVYYFIDLQSPCPTLLVNTWANITPVVTYTSLADFIVDATGGDTTNLGPLLQGGGLYPAGGFINNCGAYYDQKLNAYMTLQSGDKVNGYTPAKLFPAVPESGYGVYLALGT